MLESIRRASAVPQIPVQAVLPGLAVGALGWLLVQGFIQPIAVYLLQIYLSF